MTPQGRARARAGSPLDRASRSLLLTGLAEVWDTLREPTRARAPRIGLLFMIVSAAAFAFMAAVAKKLLPDTPVQAVVLSRGVLMALVFGTLAMVQGVPLRGRRPGVLLLRGLLGYGALSCYFASVQHLPLGDAVLLQYSHPVFVAAVAPLLLRERTSRGHWPLVLLALAGVALIVQPSGELRAGALLGLGGSCLSGLAYMTVRELSRTEHPLTIVLWFPLASIPPSLLAVALGGGDPWPHDAGDVAGHLLVVLTALVGQLTLTVGLTQAGAARATAVTLVGPVFGLLFGYLMFDTVPTAASLAGTTIVLGSLGLLGWREPKPRA